MLSVCVLSGTLLPPTLHCLADVTVSIPDSLVISLHPIETLACEALTPRRPCGAQSKKTMTGASARSDFQVTRNFISGLGVGPARQPSHWCRYVTGADPMFAENIRADHHAKDSFSDRRPAPRNRLPLPLLRRATANIWQVLSTLAAAGCTRSARAGTSGTPALRCVPSLRRQLALAAQYSLAGGAPASTVACRCRSALRRGRWRAWLLAIGGHLRVEMC